MFYRISVDCHPIGVTGDNWENNTPLNTGKNSYNVDKIMKWNETLFANTDIEPPTE
jgi:hypothetical protein